MILTKHPGDPLFSVDDIRSTIRVARLTESHGLLPLEVSRNVYLDRASVVEISGQFEAYREAVLNRFPHLREIPGLKIYLGDTVELKSLTRDRDENIDFLTKNYLSIAESNSLRFGTYVPPGHSIVRGGLTITGPAFLEPTLVVAEVVSLDTAQKSR